MELKIKQYDALQKIYGTLGHGQNSTDQECDICGSSFFTIDFKLRAFSERNRASFGRQRGTVILCLNCLDDIVALYECNRSQWLAKNDDVIRTLRDAQL